MQVAMLRTHDRQESITIDDESARRLVRHVGLSLSLSSSSSSSSASSSLACVLVKEQKNRLPRTATAPADRQTDRPAHKKCTFLASAPPPPPPSSSTPSWLCHSVEFRNRQNVKPTWGHTRFLAPNLRTEQTKGDGRKDRNVVNRQKRESRNILGLGGA
jgi:hypothetical protein